MGKITKVSLCHRKWSEEGKTYIEPALRVERDDDSKTEYPFRYADPNEPLNLESGLFIMVDKQYVWSGIRKDTIVERYVVNVQCAGQEPQVIQSFRLFTYEERGAKSPKPSRWMWNYGPLDDKFADERPAPAPNDGRRRWKRGPKANCVILGNPPPPPERGARGGSGGGGRGGPRGGGRGGGGKRFDKNRGGGDRRGGSDRRGGGDRRGGDRRSGPKRAGAGRPN